MKIMWIGHRVIVLPGVGRAAIPAFRLVAYHAPQARIEAKIDGQTTIVPIGELDWSHESIARLDASDPTPAKSARLSLVSSTGYDGNGSPVEDINIDRSQLEKLGR